MHSQRAPWLFFLIGLAFLSTGIHAQTPLASRSDSPQGEAAAKQSEARDREGKKGDRAKGKRSAAGKGSEKRPATVGPAIGENKATPLDRIHVVKGFQVELLYSVPGGEQGSWVNLCVDPRGRLLVSDQYGGLYRLTPPPVGTSIEAAAVEPVPAEVRAVNGMVWAAGALYVGVNDYEGKIPNGLYRISDSNADDQLDKVELLREIQARGDHGVHAVVPAPDGRSLYLICGNGAKPTDMAPSSPVPAIWGEDHLLPRMPDGRGFMRDVLAPGGIVYRVSLDGTKFEAVASGFRNIYDAAWNQDGELFTYDADMEYDFNTSWYRPTRICHVVSGAEFGWRNGAGKRPEFYPDNLPAVLNIGPGSPTGLVFGYGAKFPAKYQQALFALDWSWGKLYAVHLEPHGATYRATHEEFLGGAPLPITDAVIHPTDGAMYFTIGGRRVQSGLYRVTYIGKEPTAPVPAVASDSAAREQRRRLEAFHGRVDSAAIDACWKHLGDPDRFLRWAARTALEHQPLASWSERALNEPNPAIRVELLLGLARVGGVCPQHRRDDSPPVDEALGQRLRTAWLEVDPRLLNAEQQLTWARGLQIILNRFRRPDEATRQQLLARLDERFPAPNRELNWLLIETLVFLQSPTVAEKGIALITQAPTQEEQIEYARSLRMLTAGWTPALRRIYFEWFLKAANYRGGASFEKFIEFIRQDAEAALTDSDREAIADVLARKPERRSAIDNLSVVFAGRTPTNWTLEELSGLARKELQSRDFDRGRRMFAAAACFTCHRFANEGGMTGPDLTAAGRRYSPHDLLDQVLNPSKEINEQFASLVVVTTQGQVHTGVVVNLSGDNMTLNTDLSDPNQRVTIDRKEIESLDKSKQSPMPTGLLNLLTKDEVLDLLAYVISGGDRAHALFHR